MKVVALYRYPVKGFTPERCTSLTVGAEGRVAGDRVLAFRFASSPAPDAAWTRKHECVVLVNTPGLARLSVRYDHEARRLAMHLDRTLLVEDGLEEDGRRRLADTLAAWVQTQPENPLAGHPERLPLRLVGDGVTPRYHDNEGGHATLHSRASLDAVAEAAGDPALDEVRFRSNIVIDGAEAWAEQDWMGRRVRIGDVEFEGVRRKTRCLATHANPATGARDLPLTQILMKSFRQKEPTFAIGMVTTGAGGVIRVGDPVTIR